MVARNRLAITLLYIACLVYYPTSVLYGLAVSSLG